MTYNSRTCGTRKQHQISKYTLNYFYRMSITENKAKYKKKQIVRRYCEFEQNSSHDFAVILRPYMTLTSNFGCFSSKVAPEIVPHTPPRGMPKLSNNCCLAISGIMIKTKIALTSSMAFHFHSGFCSLDNLSHEII